MSKGMTLLTLILGIGFGVLLTLAHKEDKNYWYDM